MIRIRFSPRASLPLLAVPLLLLLTASPEARAFCGFYVAQGDAKIYNQSSKVVIARDGDRTVLTMASDFQGDPKEFAVVIPVPTSLKREQIHVIAAASAATTVLPEPTSPCSRRCIGTSRCRSVAISSPTRRCASVSENGSAASSLSCRPCACNSKRGARCSSRSRLACSCGKLILIALLASIGLVALIVSYYRGQNSVDSATFKGVMQARTPALTCI